MPKLKQFVVKSTYDASTLKIKGQTLEGALLRECLNPAVWRLEDKPKPPENEPDGED